MAETLEKKLERQLEEANEKLRCAKEECAKAEIELADAKKYQTLRLQGETFGKQFIALLEGMEAAGMSHDDAMDILLVSLKSTMPASNHAGYWPF